MKTLVWQDSKTILHPGGVLLNEGRPTFEALGAPLQGKSVCIWGYFEPLWTGVIDRFGWPGVNGRYRDLLVDGTVSRLNRKAFVDIAVSDTGGGNTRGGPGMILYHPGY